MILYRSIGVNVTNVTKMVNRCLTEREKKWTAEQKLLRDQRIRQKIENTKKSPDYTKKLLVDSGLQKLVSGLKRPKMG